MMTLAKLLFLLKLLFAECKLIQVTSRIPYGAAITSQNPFGNRYAFLRRECKYPHLLAFHSKDCNFCNDMEEYIDKVMKETGVHIERLYIAVKANYNLLLKLDRITKCGGLPYYYNLLTHKHICGGTTYENLKAWALGLKSYSNLPSPIKPEEIEASYRGTGTLSRIMNAIRKILIKGEQKMFDRDKPN